MTLKFVIGPVLFTNNTDSFYVLLQYRAFINQPLVAGNNSWEIIVQDKNSVFYGAVGETVLDNGLAQTYAQVHVGPMESRRLLIPPSMTTVQLISNASIGTYGLFAVGTFEEVVGLLTAKGGD